MIERIDTALCNGCGVCINSCFVDVIRMDKKAKKAIIKYPDDCMSCGICKMDCPQHAIDVSQRTFVFPITSWGL